MVPAILASICRKLFNISTLFVSFYLQISNATPRGFPSGEINVIFVSSEDNTSTYGIMSILGGKGEL